ncbi:MAG TPA: hypothetical protein VFW65_40900 [Pseudonocardiaceae bacterium]|nr:hypothetical protein [Pseudonocardiaceae bacterium]
MGRVPGDFPGNGGGQNLTGPPGSGGWPREESPDDGPGLRGRWRTPGQEPAGGGVPLGARSGGPADGQDTPGGGFRDAQPGQGAGLGDGEPEAPGAGARSSAGAAALEQDRGFGPAGTAGQRDALTTPGMMAGRGGGEGAEGEHTNKYVRGDPRELFVGDLPLVAPPTIGPPPLPPPAPPQQDC